MTKYEQIDAVCLEFVNELREELEDTELCYEYLISETKKGCHYSISLYYPEDSQARICTPMFISEDDHYTHAQIMEQLQSIKAELIQLYDWFVDEGDDQPWE